MIDQSTICAISTPPGTGAIAVIRLSGTEAITITDKIFISPKKKKLLTEQKANTLHFGQIVYNNLVIDDVIVALFKGPNSFTGENIAEISCHGSVFIQQKIIEILLENGARMASPGEFTQRAFLNGKMDLSQAEAIADLIASTSAATHRLAISQMRGGFSKELAELRRQLLYFISMIELELDFSEEDVEFADRKKLFQIANNIEKMISRLVDSFSVGNAIKNGVPVAIIGETNVGKSTLLNVLLNEEKAIVSDIHGTTRDVIEDTINIGGIMFRFIDTAGIRDTNDIIEALGIERTFRNIEQAEIILWVIDSREVQEQIQKLSAKILPIVQEKQLIFVLNKTDLLSIEKEKELNSILVNYTDKKNIQHLSISAKERVHINALRSLLVEASHLPTVTQNDTIITNIRHYEALILSLNAIRRVQQSIEMNISGDLLSQDIKECTFHLGDIVGQVTNDQVLVNIFENFCIGK